MQDQQEAPAKPEHTWPMLCHLVGLLGLLPLGWLRIFMPYGAVAFVWALRKEEPAVRENARSSLNWQLTIGAAFLLAFAVMAGSSVLLHRMSSSEMEALSLQLGQTATEAEREALTLQLRKQEIQMAGPTSPSFMALLAGGAILFLLGLLNIYQVIRNSIRAFRGEEARYPFSFPVFALAGRKGWIR